MDDALTILLNEAIDSNLTDDELLASVADATAAIAAAHEALSDRNQAETSNTQSIAVRAKRLDAQLDETQKRRTGFIKKYYNGSFKYGLADEADTWVAENAQAQILRESILYGESLIEGLARAKRAATLRLLETQRDWCHAQGLLEAHRAYQLFLPVLKNDSGAKIDLKSSKTAAYATKILEMEKLISEYRAKEAQYGYQD